MRCLLAVNYRRADRACRSKHLIEASAVRAVREIAIGLRLFLHPKAAAVLALEGLKHKPLIEAGKVTRNQSFSRIIMWIPWQKITINPFITLTTCNCFSQKSKFTSNYVKRILVVLVTADMTFVGQVIVSITDNVSAFATELAHSKSLVL